jgi:soluble lytic murein transglycosylase
MRLLLCFCLYFSAVAFADQDADFIEANKAFLSRNTDKLDSLAPDLHTSPLEIYVTYYQLRLNLESQSDERVLAFLARPEDSPLIDKLRGEWLKILASQQRWEIFDRLYPSLLNEDAELACAAMQARSVRGIAMNASEVKKLWLTGKHLPNNCDSVFTAARDMQILSEPLVWQRFSLSLASNNVSLAKQLAPQLSGTHQVTAEQLARASADPDRYLRNNNFSKANEGERAVALFSLQRLSKQSADVALTHWQKIAVQFPLADQQKFYANLAFEAAREHDSRAVQWYKSAGNLSLNELQLAWRTRAALRELNWSEVLRSINAMDASQLADPTWRYWKARALQAQGETNEALKIFAPLSTEYTFYGQMASNEISTTPQLSAVPLRYQPSTAEINTLKNSIGAQRTLALYRLDLRAEARLEWIWLLRNFNDQELLTAAEFAKRNEMFDRAIGAAEKTSVTHDFNLRYLAPYRAALKTHINDNNLEEAWVYGLMRQESRFASSARSHVGAAGLMQIMPSTARWVAKKLGLSNYNDSLIADLDTNLKLGTYYMKNVLSSADDSPVMASAAYNAGPGRARKWRGEQALEGAIYAETIPFDETRDYVKKVMSNTNYYAKQFGAPTRSLKERMGVIAGKTVENQKAIADEK